MGDAVYRRQARSFGSAAERYDQYRPTYATRAVTWALGEAAIGGPPRRVVDLGAGTGILSRQVAGLGHDVVAVEPDDLMRGRLSQVSPEIAALPGTAEAIPLPDQSVDAVVAGQAYHWFDQEHAHPEIARVLRPGGVFAAIRNDADDAVPWTVRFTAIIDGSIEHRHESPVVDFGDRFDPVELAEFRNELWVTPDHLVAVATTRSPYLVADEHGQGELIEAIRAMLVEFGLAGADRIAMPHLTRVSRAIRR